MRPTRSNFLKALSWALAGAVLWAAIHGQPACGEVPQASALEAGYDSMYNLQFAAAHQIFARYQRTEIDIEHAIPKFDIEDWTRAGDALRTREQDRSKGDATNPEQLF